MISKICYWDEIEGKQKERDAMPDEQAEIDARSLNLTIPRKVTRMKGLQALFLNGVTAQMVQDKINLMPSPQKELATIEFNEALDFERYRPLVIQMGQTFNLDLDALFIQAEALP